MTATSPSPHKPTIIAVFFLSLLFAFAAQQGLSRAEHAFQIGRV